MLSIANIACAYHIFTIITRGAVNGKGMIAASIHANIVCTTQIIRLTRPRIVLMPTPVCRMIARIRRTDVVCRSFMTIAILAAVRQKNTPRTTAPLKGTARLFLSSPCSSLTRPCSGSRPSPCSGLTCARLTRARLTITKV